MRAHAAAAGAPQQQPNALSAVASLLPLGALASTNGGSHAAHGAAHAVPSAAVELDQQPSDLLAAALPVPHGHSWSQLTYGAAHAADAPPVQPAAPPAQPAASIERDDVFAFDTHPPHRGHEGDGVATASHTALRAPSPKMTSARSTSVPSAGAALPYAGWPGYLPTTLATGVRAASALAADCTDIQDRPAALSRARSQHVVLAEAMRPQPQLVGTPRDAQSQLAQRTLDLKQWPKRTARDMVSHGAGGASDGRSGGSAGGGSAGEYGGALVDEGAKRRKRQLLDRGQVRCAVNHSL
jgi:hypothetical protein